MRKALPLTVLALVLVLAGCGKSDDGGAVASKGGSSSTTTTVAPKYSTDYGSSTPSTAAAGGADATGGTIAISIKNFAFTPNKVKAKAGALTINVSNDDSTAHTFSSDQLKVAKRLNPGEKATLQVTMPASGTVQWHCDIHSSMTGEFTIG